MIGDIERAIAARIKAASNAGILGYQFETIASYSDAAVDAEQGVIEFPAMWVVFAGEGEPTDVGGGHYIYRPIFAVMVAAEEWVSKTFDRTKADSGKPGSYLLLSDVRKLLINQTFGLSIAPLEPGRVMTIKNETNLSIISIEFSTEYEETMSDFDMGLADFLRFRADYDIPTHGNVVPPLPTVEADARDAVDLPGPSH